VRRAARTIDGLIRRLDLRRGVFIKKEEGRREKGAAMFRADSFIQCQLHDGVEIIPNKRRLTPARWVQAASKPAEVR
jgi:hypothetical protein